MQQFAALALAQAFPDDHVDTAGFVLQRDEHHALGGLRLLACHHNAAGAYQTAIGQVAQLRGREQFHLCQLVAQQRHRMAAQCQAGGRIVEHHLGAFAGCGQRQKIFVYRHGLEQSGRGSEGAGLPDLLAPVARQGSQRVGAGQRLEVALAEPGAQGQVLGAGKGGFGAGVNDARSRVGAQARDHAQAQPYGGLLLRAPGNGGHGGQNGGQSPISWKSARSGCWVVLNRDLTPIPARSGCWVVLNRDLTPISCLQRAIPIAAHHVHCAHFNAMALRVLHQLRRAVEPQRLCVEQRGQKTGRLVALEPGTHIHQQRETGRVALRETVFTKPFDLPEYLFRERSGITICNHAVHHAVIELVHPTGPFPRRHRAAQLVGFIGAEPGSRHGDLHHLLLKNRHPQRARECRTQALVRVRLPGQAAAFFLAPLQIRMHHIPLDRARPDNRHLDHQVVITAGLQARQHAHLRPAFDLEHTHRIGGANHVVRGRVFRRNVLHPQRRAALLADKVQAAADRAEHAQGQHIDLEQAHRIQIVFFPLDHKTLVHGGFLHRHQAREFALGQDKTAHVLAQVARKPEQLAGQIQPLVYAHIPWLDAGRCQTFGQRWYQHDVLVKPALLLGKGIDQRIVQPQGLADIPDRTFATIGHHHSGQCSAVVAVFLVDVLDDFLAPLMFEVHVDIGRLIAFAADETRKQHIHARRVDLGHAKAITDRGIGGRTAALAQDMVLPRKTHDVVHGQKVHLVLQFSDQFQLMLHLGLHAGWHAVRVPCTGPLQREPAQGLCGGQTRQHGLHRVLVTQLVQAETAARGDGQRGLQPLARVNAGQTHPCTQMRLGIGLQRKTAIRHRLAKAHCADHVLQRFARAHMHMHIAGRNQRHAGMGGSPLQHVLPQVVIQAVQQLQCEPEPLAKQASGAQAMGAQGFKGYAAWRRQQDFTTLQLGEITAAP